MADEGPFSGSEYLERLVRDLELTVADFGAGVEKKRALERWVVCHFLRGLELKFEGTEVLQPVTDPPDATFRGAAFEVKEIGEPGRRRHDEYREALAKVKAATSPSDLLKTFSVVELPIAAVYARIFEATAVLAARKYVDVRTRGGLDLLFYINLDPAKAWSLVDGLRPDVSQLEREGWRSASFLHGDRTSCAIHTSAEAPPFLRAAVGRALHSRPIARP